MKKIFILLLTFFLLITTVEASPTKKECQDALVNSGYAYYYRGKALQYDSKLLTFQGGDHKQGRNGGSNGNNISSGVFYSPEDATIQDNKYTVCSGFVAHVLYESFKNSKGEGYILRDSDNNFLRNTIKIITLGDSKSDKDIVAYYSDKIGEYKDNKQTDKLKEVYKKLQDTLEPGDIVVRTTKTGGHALMYMGNDIFLESVGDSSNRESEDDSNFNKYDFDKKSDNVEPNGTIKKTKFKRYTDWSEFQYSSNISGYTSPRSLIGGSVKKIIVIRVANRVSNSSEWKISDNAKNRSKYPHLSFTKTANRNKYQSISLEDSITYTITLTNNSSKDYTSIKVTDKVPSNMILESMTTNYSGKNSSGSLSWTVNIPKNGSVKLSYKVRVPKNNNLLGTYIVNNNTKVNGIKLNTIKTLIAWHLTTDTKDKLNSLKIGDSYESTASLLNYLYKGMNFPEPSVLISKLFSNKTEKNNKTYILKDKSNLSSDDKRFMNMYVPGLFGGYYTYKESNPKFNDDRSLTFDSNSFSLGDILLVVDSNYKKDGSTFGITDEIGAYVYLGDSTFVTVQNKKLVIIDSKKGSKLIESLLGQNCFITLRPMKAYRVTTTTTVDVTGISLNKTSTTLKVGSSETLTYTITPSNATNKNVTWSSSNTNVATVSNGMITGINEGTATITVKTNNGKTANCVVTVKKDAVTPSNPEPVTPSNPETVTPSNPEQTTPNVPDAIIPNINPSKPEQNDSVGDENNNENEESEIVKFVKDNAIGVGIAATITLLLGYAVISGKH